LILTAVGYAGTLYYPDTSPPRGSDAERRIAEVFGAPAGADGSITGDLLVERFYAVDAETGELFVADWVKGKIQRVQETVNENGILTYALLLDVSNLQRETALLSAFVDQVAPPDPERGGNYLGLRVPNGLRDAFPLNYDGLLPAEKPRFHVGEQEDFYGFLVGQRFDDVTLGARLINVDGYNFLLSNTALWSHFRELFRINKAVFMSELIVVDMTSRPQAGTYFRLMEQYPRRSQ
jgi:hypothetical protein